MNLFSFYQQQYDADPYRLLDAAYHELSVLAAEAGIDWSAVADKIRLAEVRGAQEKFSSYNKSAPKSLEKKLRGRVELYSRIDRTRDGLPYPFVNFVRKGADAGTWSGLQFLFNEYNRAKSTGDTTPVVSKNTELLAKRRAEREKLERLAAIEEQKKLAENKKSYDDFLNKFESASRENGTFEYAKRKQITEIFDYCDVRTLRWGRAPTSIMAIPLSRINDNKIVGWQRIYSDGSKKLTSALTAGDYVGACHVIGDLKHAKKIVLAEGFATAATVFLSAKNKFDAAIMCVSANNLINVVDQLVELYPWLDIVIALDNDHATAQRGDGNTGIKYGLEILKKHPKIKCVYPKFNNLPDNEKLSDFNDLYIRTGKRETTRQLFSHDNKLAITSDQLKNELTTLSVTSVKNKKLFVQQLYRCVDVGMSRCPVDYSPRELVELINKYLRHLNVLNVFEGTVRSRVGRQFAKSQIRAQAARSFSNKITDPTLRPDHITYKRFKTHVINDEILTYIKTLTGPVIVRAGMGSGKSKHLLRPLMHNCTSGISLAHRVSLAAGLWDMMTDGNRAQTDIFNYQEQGLNEISGGIKKLILCVNSIIKGCWRPLVREHGFLGFDEATQGLRAICTSKIVKYPVDVFNQLILAIASSREHAVLVDADANDTLIELCEIAIKKREELELDLEPWSQIHVIELPVDVSYTDEHGKNKPREVFYTDCDRVFAEILEAAKNNEKFLLATDNKNRADQLLNELQTLYPDKNWLYVSQDTTPSADVMAFTDAPNKFATQYDGLIYSPAISSGVSIEVQHFKRHFGLFSGVVVPSDAIQMLRRDRTATSFMIGLDKITGQRAETAENIRTGFIQAMIETGEINQEYCDASLENGKLSLGLADTQFTKMKMKIMELEATARANFANNIIHILDADGYDVKHLARDDGKSACGREIRNEAKKRVHEIELMRYLEEKTPDIKLRDELLAKRTLTEGERAQLTRFDIENELCLDVTPETIDFWLAGGKNKIKLVEIRDMSPGEAATIDRDEQSFVFLYKYKLNGISDYMVLNALSQADADERFKKAHPNVDSVTVSYRPAVDVTSRTYASLHRKLLRQYFNDCGIDIETGAGEVTAESMQLAMDNLIKTDRIQMFNNVIRFGGYAGTKNKPKRPDTVFKSVCKALGYKTDKRRLPRSQGRGYVWFIDSDSWQFISNITEQRKKSGKTQQAKYLEIIKPDHNDRVIPDLGSIYNNRYQIEDHQTPPTWNDLVATAIDGLPIDINWAIEVLRDDEREWFVNEHLPIQVLTNTLIRIYITEYLGAITPQDLDVLKQRMLAA